MKKSRSRLSVGVVALVSAAALATADTLVLRDGETIEGRLVGADRDTIEFRTGRWSGRVRSFDREDVERIEFDGGRRRGDRNEDRGRPRGMREKTVTASAHDPWTDTGVDVRRRMEIYFDAKGKVHWGPGRRDDAGGESGSHKNPGRPMPNRPGAALIGKVGRNGAPFLIGKEEGPFRMRSSGRLYLGINDDHLQDNSGGFRVTVFY